MSSGPMTPGSKGSACSTASGAPECSIRGTARLVELSLMSPSDARELIAAVRAAEARPETRMLTPPVIEIVARAI